MFFCLGRGMVESQNEVFVSRLGGLLLCVFALVGEIGLSAVLRVRVWTCGGGGG